MSKQANNRRGGPGTESNRARAARGGFDHGGRPIEHVDRERERRGLACRPAQAHARGRMRAGAEREARIDAQVDGGRVRQLAPGRHDPQSRRDLDRLELRLRCPHPIGLGHDTEFVRAERACLAVNAIAQGLPQRFDVFGRHVAVEERCDAAIGPALRQRHPRFAKDRLLGIAFGVQVGNIHCQCAGLK